MGAARPGREDIVLMGSMEEIPGTNADIVDAGAGKDEERLSGGVGLEE